MDAWDEMAWTLELGARGAQCLSINALVEVIKIPILFDLYNSGEFAHNYVRGRGIR